MGVRVTGQGPHLSVDDVAVFLTESVQVRFLETPFQEGPGVHAGRGVSLEEHLVAAPGVVLAPEEVVHPHLVKGRGGGVGGDVAADADARALGPVNGDGGVPAEQAADLAFQVLVPRVGRFLVRRDGVDVVGAGQRGNPDVAFTRPFQQFQHDVAGTVAATVLDHPVERLQPLGGLPRIRVREVRRQAVEDRPDLVLDAHVSPLVAMCAQLWQRYRATGFPRIIAGPRPPHPACKPAHTVSR